MDSGSGFQSLSVDLGSWFPVVNGVPGFRIPQAKFPGFRNGDSLLWGEIFNQKKISLSLNFIVNVQKVYAKTAERRHTINLKIKLFIDTNWHFLNYKEVSHFRNEKVPYSFEVASSTTITTMYLFKEI